MNKLDISDIEREMRKYISCFSLIEIRKWKSIEIFLRNSRNSFIPLAFNRLLLSLKFFSFKIATHFNRFTENLAYIFRFSTTNTRE